ncbi:MAG: hypothetical protein RI924_309 [Bacteroidota bacterium]|jgi:1,4-dihydroxy-2-naphthoate octaprenyltransferase
MKKQFRVFLDFLLFSNSFIALGAAAQVAFSYQLIGVQINLYLVALVFFASLAFYNFSMLLSKPADPPNSPFKRMQWMGRHEYLVKCLILMSALAVIGIGIKLSVYTQALLVCLGMISLSYNLPVFPSGGQRVGLRNLPGGKVFLIALVWTLSVLMLPLTEYCNTGYEISRGKIVYLLLHRFLFISALLIPFDIRDLKQDARYQLKTLPTLLGTHKAYRLSKLLLFSSLAFCSFIVPVFSMEFAAMLSTTLIFYWFIFEYSGQKNEYYYFFYLDGLLLLPWLFILLLNLLF